MTRPLYVLTAAEMRAADERAAQNGTPVETLMERAGEGAVEAIERHFGTQRGYRVAVVCGKGNNGGDGFVVARLLAKRGAQVEVVSLAEAGELKGATASNFGRLDGTGAKVGADLGALERADLVVDGMLGTGVSGALGPAHASAVRAVNAARARGAKVVALDLPTGVHPDTGRAPDGEAGGTDARAGSADAQAVTADLTVAFAHLRPVHVLYPGRTLCGTVEVVDIGVEPPTATVESTTPEWAESAVPRRAPTAHKGDAGRVFLVGGSVGLTGAVVLASKAALRAGAGLVTAGVPESVNDAIEAAMIEPMTMPLPESPERALTAEALPQVLARAREAQCLALGPGLSRTPESGELARAIVEQAATTIVLDADGLYAFAGDHAARFAARRGGVSHVATHPGAARNGAALILTPHLGEMSRLTGRPAAQLEEERLTAPRAYAAQWNAVVVMKGAPTVTAAPDGRMTVNSTGNPGMATAGMGDVLTGVIAGFVAQGMSPYDAARLGVYVHGLAGDVARARVGTLSLMAGDVIDALPIVLSGLEHRR